ncbi:MAG: PGPGW domain-containing protein [Alphaproteobacteria bacterium]|nr:PGPGW domain-containing protein [Alphaproteobacteria bacterium]
MRRYVPEDAPPAVQQAARVLVVLGGASLALVGIALLFLPGPGTVTLAAGLALLATEFVWARRWLQRLREHAEDAVNKVTKKAPGGPPPDR